MNIIHRVGIQAPVSKVYAALTTIDGLSGWWTRDTTGDARPGGAIEFRFRSADGKDIGGFGMDVLEQAPGQRVRWRVKEGPAEWLGTEIDFELTQEDGFTIVRFGHRGWPADGDFMAHCSTKWATFLLSLRDMVETGQGRPAPHDLKISNWH
ncbi:SRPBCC domain-containing protein [Roseateles sp.]|uniref:SRPBCC family protein n=1 Tax=Roseateles sp. TaxID=1971397 RepID=UPI002E062ACC|nr:SRPBCC domain-containing protein [Roseateles sp.]